MSLASVGCFRSTLKVLSKDMHSYTITRTNKMRLHHKSDSQSINLYKNANTKIRKMLFSNTSDHVKEKDKIDMSKFPVENIRNFCIIAHVDHGKSTLADRLLEITGAIVKRSDNKQVLDKLQVERERGITVKAQTASLFYEYKGKTYLLNLIDTPGHVDFNYEVSRSLSACQGALLLVDANQGVQAQTVANFFLAFDSELTVIPVLNKIDLKNADPEMCIAQMKTVFDMSREEILLVSAKLGMGVEELLHEIIERIPPPRADVLSPLKALVFDSSYDRYKGVIANAAILDGQVKVGDRVTFAFTQKNYEVQKLGVMRPQEELVNSLYAGQIGFIIVNMKNASEACVGDTFFLQGKPVEAIHGFKPAKPMVFAGVYPTDQSEFPALRSAVSRLTLNDSSVSVAMDASPALGQGFRLGFLGLLHMEVFNQRLEQEHNTSVIVTVPSVPYKFKIMGEKNIKKYRGEHITIINPCEYPDEVIITEKREPMVIGTVITPTDHISTVTNLCMARRGEQESFSYIDEKRAMIKFKMPLSEIIIDFYDELKATTSGYASFDYEDAGYEVANLVKMRFLLNSVEVDELTHIVNLGGARDTGRRICEKLRDSIPRQLFDIMIQAVVGGKVLARENIKALKKNVLAKCYGGDISRKMKLLKRQAEGKKRMRKIGNISVPRDVFITVLKR